MQPQQFKIESYEIADNIISVMLEQNNITLSIDIPLYKFEWWLRIHDKFEWVLNLSDHSGAHQQFTGTMTLEEYWATNYGINEDLYDYISHNNPVTMEGCTFTNSMESILLAFELRSVPYQTRWEHEQEIFDNFLTLDTEN